MTYPFRRKIESAFPRKDPGPISDARLRQVFALWSEAAVEGRPPSKDFVDPAKRQEGRRAFWQGMLSKIETWRRGDKPKEA